jgi:hypothetical protein
MLMTCANCGRRYLVLPVAIDLVKICDATDHGPDLPPAVFALAHVAKVVCPVNGCGGQLVNAEIPHASQEK